MSWIALSDVVGAIELLLRADAVSGPVNLAGPNPATNAELTRALSNELHRPALFPVPRLALELLFGEMADDTILASQRVMPRRLVGAGYRFRFPTLDGALAHELHASF